MDATYTSPAPPRNGPLRAPDLHPIPHLPTHHRRGRDSPVSLNVIWTPAGRELTLRFIEEPAHRKLVVRARSDAYPADHGRLQLCPARIAPVVARKRLGLVSTGQLDNAAAELVGAAHGGFDRGPPLAEFEGAGDDHLAFALELELVAVGIAFVRDEEELEPCFFEVRV